MQEKNNSRAKIIHSLSIFFVESSKTFSPTAYIMYVTKNFRGKLQVLVPVCFLFLKMLSKSMTSR